MDLTKLYKISHEYQLHYLWNREEIQHYQQSALRQLLHYCYHHSPWYRRCLRHINIEKFCLSDLTQLPLLDKNELMNSWDSIVTDHTLKLNSVYSWFEQGDYSTLLHNKYLCWATGGTSGQQGITVWSINDFLHYISIIYRPTIYAIKNSGRDECLRLVTIVASTPKHMSYQLWTIPFLSTVTVKRLDIYSKVEYLVEQLLAYQPTDIVAYPSILAMIARYCKLHRCIINAQRIILTAEPIIDEDFKVIKYICPHAVISNFYGATEAGPLAITCHCGKLQYLCADATLLEPVDDTGQPVSNNQLSADLYVTNLINYTLPLIRYQLGDRVMITDDGCYCGINYPVLTAIEGRKFPSFRYGNIEIETKNIYLLLIKHPHILSLQGRQTEHGMVIQLYTIGTVELPLLAAKLKHYLKNAGLVDPYVKITMQAMNGRNRQVGSSKLSYFIQR